MPRYSEQFKRDAVALYENNEDLSLHAASAELGISRLLGVVAHGLRAGSFAGAVLLKPGESEERLTPSSAEAA